MTADLAVFAALGAFGTSCITALTVQSTLGVRATYPIPTTILRQTLACLASDLPPSAVKIGMLATAENVEAVAEFIALIRQDSPTPVVLDPVMRSSSGAQLLGQRGIEAMQTKLLPLADWITPNLEELALLTNRSVANGAEMEAATAELQTRFTRLGIVATGGHLGSADDLVCEPGKTRCWIPGSRIVSLATHGTGCAFSSAMAYSLADGMTGLDAARRAKAFVEQAISRAQPFGHGKGPMNLYWPLRETSVRCGGDGCR